MRIANKQGGAVSIFIVIFTALLVTVVTASFTQIMLRNQQQATNNDLSQSAYDSALAGVEDAKRALVQLKTCQQGTPNAACNSLASALDSGECDSLDRANLVTFNNGEAQVGSTQLNQAYTCVIVNVNTPSVEGVLARDETVVIPLDVVGSDDQITGVEISWFTAEDQPLDVNGLRQPPTFATPPTLQKYGDWDNSNPPLMRAQFIQFTRGNITLDSFDTVDSNNALTRFLYPFPAGNTNGGFAVDRRRAGTSGSSSNSPLVTSCANNFTTVQYLCSIRLSVPALANRQAYLQLASLYGGAHYRIRPIGASGFINFSGVQPEIDSTGRASDLFRRVKARVSVTDSGSEVTFPNAALDINKNFCKDFFITNQLGDYDSDTDGTPCDPRLTN